MYPVSVRGLGEFKYTSATREEIKRNFYSPQVSKRGLETHVMELTVEGQFKVPVHDGQ